MKKINIHIYLLVFALFISNLIYSQNHVVTDGNSTKVQTVAIHGDTSYTIILDKDQQIVAPQYPTEYSIASYKNVDYLKINPFQLESAGLHPEIYISNTHKGVIIISSAEANEVLKDFSKNLELNPNLYETINRQDTTIFSAGNIQSPAFDYTRSSTIMHDYHNAFKSTYDPHSGVSWSIGSHKDFIQEDLLNKVVYDLIIVIPKKSTR